MVSLGSRKHSVLWLPARLCRGVAMAGLFAGVVVSGCRKDPDQQASGLLREVDAALAQQRWEQAQKKAHDTAQLAGLSDALRDQARLKEEQARSEQQAKIQYARFLGGVDGDHDTAMAAYRDLPANSYYRTQAKEAYDKLRPVYLGEHLEKAQAALKNSRCDDLKAQLQQVMDVDSANTQAMELSKQPCTPGKEP